MSNTQNNRLNSLEESVRTAFLGLQADLWTAIPGVVDSFDPSDCTATIIPSIKLNFTDSEGNTAPFDVTVLQKVPVVIYSGGGFVVTCPVKSGDEALVVFSSRCMDGWWQSGGTQVQAEGRMHSVSDGFAIIGPRSVPRALPAYNTSALEIRTEDGTVKLALTETSVEITAPGGLLVNGVPVTGV